MEKKLDIENLKNRKLYAIPVDLLEPDPNQPRKYFDEKSIKRLAASIKTDKVLQPILFTKQPESNQLTIVSGERRWRASKLIEMETIPGIYIAKPSEFIALAENMVREELTPIERAEAIQRIVEDGKFTHEIVAARLGKSRATITNILSLAKLPEEIKANCRNTKEYPLRELIKVARKPTAKGQITAFQKLREKVEKDDHEKTKNVTRKPKLTPIELEEANTKKMLQLCKQLCPLVQKLSGSLGSSEIEIIKQLEHELASLLTSFEEN
jgi:ParB family chromosome partitioning protein